MATVKDIKAKKSPASKTAAAEAHNDNLPTPEEAVAAYAQALGPDLARPRTLLLGLRHQAPQLVHLEGGQEPQRVALALWWAALLNCVSPGSDGPCLACPACMRIGAGVDSDLIQLDGRQGSIKIDEVRALRPLLGEPPRFNRMRVIVITEAQALGIEAANSLLKSLEEPCLSTCFIFSAPQRERLLPTLVSRGWVITLPWPDPARPLSESMDEWEQALAGFLEAGTGWFEKTSVKGNVDATGAQHIVLLGQKALADHLAQRRNSRLAAPLADASESALAAADELFSRCQEALQVQVNPALVLDYMVSQLYRLVHGHEAA